MAESVHRAITHRIATQHVDLIAKYGLTFVMAEIDEETSFVGDVEEIGSSDISCWVNAIKDRLANQYGART